MKDLWEQPASLDIPAHIRALATTALRAAREGHRDECIGPLADWLGHMVRVVWQGNVVIGRVVWQEINGANVDASNVFIGLEITTSNVCQSESRRLS